MLSVVSRICGLPRSLHVSEVLRITTTNCSPEGVVQRENFPGGIDPKTGSLMEEFSEKVQPPDRAALMLWYKLSIVENRAIYTPTFVRVIAVILSNNKYSCN